MSVSVRIVPWASLVLGVDPVRVLVEQLSPKDERARFGRVVKAPPAIPAGYEYEGDAGTLSDSLERLLACPLVSGALTVTLVPFSICGFDDPYDAFEVDFYASPSGFVHRHTIGVDSHLLVDANYLQERWAQAQDEDLELGLRVEASLASPAASDERRGLWLLHELVERYVPAAQRLGLPIVVEWTDRARLADAGPSANRFEDQVGDQLDALFGVSSADTVDDAATDELVSADDRPDVGVIVLEPMSERHVAALPAALIATAKDYALDPSTARVAFSKLRSALLVYLRAPGFETSYDLHATLDHRLDPALGGSFGASLSGQLVDLVREQRDPGPSAWTVMRRTRAGATTVHEGFMYTYESTDHAEDDGPLRRLAERLRVPVAALEEVLESPDVAYVRLDESIDAALDRVRSRH